MNTRFLHSSNPNIRFPTRWSYGARNDYSGDMNYSLSYQVDLRKVLPGRVMVGFSDATGAYVERHILQSWEFNSSLNTVLKGEDNSKEWKLAAGIAVPLGVLVLVACVVFWRKHRKPVEEPVEVVASTSMNDDLER
ncbi:putative non-specific serine/threonine protein kinase [Helianthus annuus]|nr:putative non-specific serine/threonine protein kinase [Helianthus annuus]KAJ0840817.1 putative non-specific serine/threonine protein kinase [Helianthus annuus]KAJ0854242.1 putative non-specific serine/threonine protein kinase [Helianthus annuus]